MMRTVTMLSAFALLVACSGGEGSNGTSTNNASNQMNANGTTSENVQPNNTQQNVDNTSPNNTNVATNNATATNNTATNNTNQMTNNDSPQTCDPAFGMMQACDGDPEGTWQVDDICSDFDYGKAVTDLCPDATVVSTRLEASGTLEVTADAFTRETTGAAKLSVDLATGCEFGDCDFAANTLTTVADDAACADQGNDLCACTVTFSFDATTGGPYTHEDGVATLDSGETYYVCARGDTLQLREFGTDDDDAEPTFLFVP